MKRIAILFLSMASLALTAQNEPTYRLAPTRTVEEPVQKRSSAAVATPCSEPFFSEYIEGSGNNKGFEIYNPDSQALNLGGYQVVLSVNGGNVTNTFDRQCTSCHYVESVTAGTLFHKMKFSILKAFWIVYYVSTSKRALLLRN